MEAESARNGGASAEIRRAFAQMNAQSPMRTMRCTKGALIPLSVLQATGCVVKIRRAAVWMSVRSFQFTDAAEAGCAEQKLYGDRAKPASKGAFVPLDALHIERDALAEIRRANARMGTISPIYARRKLHSARPNPAPEDYRPS